MHLIIIIPALNEDQTIGSIISEIPRNLCDKVEVLVIDDGSIDKTVEVARKAGADYIVSNGTNCGLGYSVNLGRKKAVEFGADLMVVVDADGQIIPSEIIKIIRPIMDGKADVVTAVRNINIFHRSDMTIAKRIGNKFFTTIVNWSTGQKLSDTQCGFRAYSREAAIRLNPIGNYTHGQEDFIEAKHHNLRVEEVYGVNINLKREHGSSRQVKNPISYGIKAMTLLLRSFRDQNPLKFFGFPGLIFLIISIFMGLILVFTSSNDRSQYFSWIHTDYIMLLSFLGFSLIILALLADMNSRIRKINEDTFYKVSEVLYTYREKE